MASSIWLGTQLTAPVDFALALVVLVYFGVVTVIDLEHRLILHPVNLAGAAIGLGIGAYQHGWMMALLGSLAGLGGMLAVYILGIILIQVLDRWRNASIGGGEALGFGDVAFSGVIGLMLGWPTILAGLMLAIVVAGIASLFFMLSMALLWSYHPGLTLSYSPFLVFSAAVLLFLF